MENQQFDKLVKHLVDAHEFSAKEADWQSFTNFKAMLEEGDNKKTPFWKNKYFTTLLLLLFVGAAGIAAYFVANKKPVTIISKNTIPTSNFENKSTDTNPNIVKDTEMANVPSSTQLKNNIHAVIVPKINETEKQITANKVNTFRKETILPSSKTKVEKIKNVFSFLTKAKKESTKIIEPLSQNGSVQNLNNAPNIQIEENTNSTTINIVQLPNTIASIVKKEEIKIENLPQTCTVIIENIKDTEVAPKQLISMPEVANKVVETIKVVLEKTPDNLNAIAVKQAMAPNFQKIDLQNKWQWFVAAGFVANAGMKGNFSTKKQLGVSPYAGVEVQKYFSEKWSVASGISYSNNNAINTQYQKALSKYYWGRDTAMFTIQYKNYHFVALPVTVNYALSNYLQLQVGSGITYMLDVQSNLYDKYFGNRTEYGYGIGLNRVDAFAMVGTQLKVSPRFKIQINAQQGFVDITKNNYFNNTVVDKHRRLQMGASYLLNYKN